MLTGWSHVFDDILVQQLQMIFFFKLIEEYFLYMKGRVISIF